MNFAHPELAIAAVALFSAALAGQLRDLLWRAPFVHSNVDFLSETLGAHVWPAAVARVFHAGGIAVLLCSAAHPARDTRSFTFTTIAICLDTSGSMNSQDILPTRAAAAAAAIRVFAAAVPGQARIALVAFAGSARTLLAPSLDRTALRRALDRAPYPNGQTAIGDALLLANTLLPAAGSRAIVMLTDGTNNRGTNPAAALQLLRASHVAVEIVAIRRGADLRGELLRLASQLTTVRAQRDLSEFSALAALALFAAAWVSRERGGLRP